MEQQNNFAPLFLSSEERSHLVRFCASLCGHYEIAEDLVQETLLEAWQHEQALRDPSRQPQWLRGIARNVYLRWQRKQMNEETHRYQQRAYQPETENEATIEGLFATDDTIERDLERKELLELLERALDLLPSETRMALIQHYIDDAPLTEIAQKLGTNPNALAVRLQRGRVTMRRLLTQDMQQEFSLHRTATENWEITPLWCYRCGKHRLLGQRGSDKGKFFLKCPGCNPEQNQLLSKNELSALIHLKSYKPMMAKLRRWCHSYYRTALSAYFNGEKLLCELCGKPGIIQLGRVTELPSWLQIALQDWQWAGGERIISTFCEHCEASCNTTLSGLVLSLPEVHTFIQEQEKIRTLPDRRLEVDGRPALLTRLESINSSAALNIISDAETYRLLRIEQEAY
ncbi:RNA polymerase sigma factor [Tengunoibacter tsumagoiensis]|uniref:RNA polymerase sigma factor n=1 Tax=Tengunoibacter tsumagoiensis TaxID=2014871 RepID=A0A402A6X2_9CHLR|nr:RNA polymerase sigma factor [Tengunoibacter tsumagoiensis]GCE14776.1 hypothetical protein KTT_46350 [Tengunoibacter tsumagoiensis]